MSKLQNFGSRVKSTSEVLAVVLVGVSVNLTGCRSTDRIDPVQPEARSYPAAAARAGSVDIQAFRDGTTLRMTNTTARGFGPSTVWVNRRFSLPIDGLMPGAGLELDLRRFIDEYGSAFRAGGFFATQRPEPVVLVELEDADGLVGVLVAFDQAD